MLGEAGQDPGSPEICDGKEMVGSIIALEQAAASQLSQGSGVGSDPCSVGGGNSYVFKSARLLLQCLSHF